MQRRTYRRKSGGATAVLILLVLVPAFVCAAAAFSGWLIMLGFGIVHGSITPSCPTPGFWPCAALGLIVSLILGGRTRS